MQRLSRTVRFCTRFLCADSGAKSLRRARARFRGISGLCPGQEKKKKARLCLPHNVGSRYHQLQQGQRSRDCELFHGLRCVLIAVVCLVLFPHTCYHSGRQVYVQGKRSSRKFRSTVCPRTRDAITTKIPERGQK